MAEMNLSGTGVAANMTCEPTLPPAFLQMPIELRDEIYSLVASTDPSSSAVTFSAQPDAAASHVYHGLLHACKQTRHEYTRVLLRYTGITATIENFDFQPFGSFLGQLPGVFLDSLPKQVAPIDFKAVKTEYLNPTAKVHILINMTDEIPAALEGFRRWQFKQRSLESTGSRLQIDYQFANRPHLQVRLGMQVLGLAADFDPLNDAITRAEILATTRALVNGVSSNEASWSWGELEASGEGPVSVNEFVRLYRDIERS